MIITVAGFKGGVGKTTTAFHLAAFLAEKSDRVLVVDSDPNRSCLNWASRGDLPFQACPLAAAARKSQGQEHIVIDTPGHPSLDDLKDFAESSDLVILPTTADAMAIEALLSAVDLLSNLGRYAVVLTMIDSRKRSTESQARAMLQREQIPVFNQSIRRLTAFERAAGAGCIVKDVSDRFAKIAWREYCSLGQEVLSYGG